VQRLAAELDLDVNEVGICHACLSFIAFPLEAGDEAEVDRALRTFVPILWEEGLALPLEAALERGRRRGIAGASDAIVDVRSRGARAAIVRAVVRRLASDLTLQSREHLKREGLLSLSRQGRQATLVSSLVPMCYYVTHGAPSLLSTLRLVAELAPGTRARAQRERQRSR
jgi:hypothetical protein